jgi:hypothetical protein
LVPPIYNIVLATAKKHLDLEMFEKIWNDFDRDKNCQKNQISYNIGLEFYSTIKDISKAKNIYLKMVSLKLDVPINTLVDLITGSIQSRKYQDAAELISSLRKTGKGKGEELDKLINIHLKGFKELIHRLGESYVSGEERNQSFLIIDVYQEILEKHAEIDESVLQVVMDAYRNVKDLVGVVKVWGRIEQQFTLPSSKSLSILLRATSELGQQKTATAIKKIIEEKKPPLVLDRVCFEYLVILYAKFTDARAIPMVLIDMINNDIPVDGKMWRIIRNAFSSRYAKEGKTAQAREAFQYVYDFVEENFPDIIQVDDEEQVLQLQKVKQDI